MCAVPTLLLPLNGDLNGQDRSGAVAASSSGALRYVDGPWSAVPATTNLLPNPRFEPTGTAWTVTGAATVAQDPTVLDGTVPSGCLTIASTGSSASLNARGPFPSLDTVQAHTFSGRLRVNRAGLSINIFFQFYDKDGTALANQFLQQVAPPTTGWLDVAYTANAQSNAVEVQLWPVTGGQAGDKVWLVKPQLERKEATPYCDGEQPLCVWNGTPNASASSRLSQPGAVTNFYANPLFEGPLDQSLFTTGGTGTITKTLLATGGVYGPGMLQLGLPNGSFLRCFTPRPMTLGVGAQVVTGSATVWADQDYPDDLYCYLYIECDDGSVIGGTSTMYPKLTTTPTRFSVTQSFTNTSPVKNIRLYFNNSAGVTKTIYVDGVQIEVGGVAPLVNPLTDPTVFWTGAANASASVRPAANRAAFVEEGTTNLIRNPSFETNTADWAPPPNLTTTLTQDTTMAYAGAASLKVVTPGSATGEGAAYAKNIITAAPNDWVTFSVSVKGSGNLALFLFGVKTDGIAATADSATLNITATGTWTRYSVSKQLTDATTGFVTGRVITNGAQAVTFSIDAAQIEKKQNATSYCDGSLGTGYSWSGTAHASSSTRAATTVSIPVTGRISPTKAAIALWVNLGRYANSGWQQLFRINGGSGKDTTDMVINVGTTQYYVTHAGKSQYVSAFPYRGQLVFFVARWNGTTIEWGVNGPPTLSLTGTSLVGDFGTASLEFNNGGLRQANGSVGPVFTADWLTDEQIMTLYKATAPWAFNTLYPRVAGIVRTATEANVALTRISPDPQIT